MRITESQLRKIVRQEAKKLQEGPANVDTQRVLILKRMVTGLLNLYLGSPESMEAMDGIRNLIEKEVGNRDIPLEYYEYKDDLFLKKIIQ